MTEVMGITDYQHAVARYSSPFRVLRFAAKVFGERFYLRQSYRLNDVSGNRNNREPNP